MTETETDDEPTPAIEHVDDSEKDEQDGEITTDDTDLTIEEVDPTDIDRTTPHGAESLRYGTRMELRGLYPIRDPTGTILFDVVDDRATYTFAVDQQVIEYRNDYDGIGDVIEEVVGILREDDMIAGHGLDMANATAKITTPDELTTRVSLVLS